MSKPSEAFKICSSLSEKIKKEFKEFDLILSPAMGGIIVGYEIGRILNKETIFSERVNGLIDRSSGKSAIKKKIVSQVKIDIPTYTEKNLPKNLLTLKAIKPGSRNL